jgi:hypothetical protein
MDGVLLAKLTFAPLCVAAASLASRRFGAQVGGWIVGFPFVAGPILWFFCAEQGRFFGAAAAEGTLLGVVCLSLFCVSYAWASLRLCWATSLLLGWTVFLCAAWALRSLRPSLPLAIIVALGAAWGGRRCLPRPPRQTASRAFPRWELPARMAATAAIVTVLTGLARWLGPGLGGLLTPFPVATSVVVVCAHREVGTNGVVRALGGLLVSLGSFIGFCTALAVSLPYLERAPAFALALAANLVLQVVVGWRLGLGGGRPSAFVSEPRR